MHVRRSSKRKPKVVHEKRRDAIGTSLFLPPLTDDQREYLEAMLASSGNFDPSVTVGGPRKNPVAGD